MKEYQIRLAKRPEEPFSSMIIKERSGERLAEYRLTPGHELADIRQMRRQIDRHVAEGGGLGDYQW